MSFKLETSINRNYYRYGRYHNEIIFLNIMKSQRAIVYTLSDENDTNDNLFNTYYNTDII